MKKTLTVVAMVLAAGAAMAGDKDKMSFTQLDANADGQISAAEASGSAQLSQSLKDIDTNGDGSVSQSEYDAWAAGSARGSTWTSRSPTSSKPRPARVYRTRAGPFPPVRAYIR